MFESRTVERVTGQCRQRGTMWARRGINTCSGHCSSKTWLKWRTMFNDHITIDGGRHRRIRMKKAQRRGAPYTSWSDNVQFRPAQWQLHLATLTHKKTFESKKTLLDNK